MIDAIILAGGLGTRLRTAVADVPKPLASIQGIPFLDLILKQLEASRIVSKIVLAIGYKGDQIIEYYQNKPPSIPLAYSLEEKPLGTGGALKQAFPRTHTDTVMVLNGDSFFDVDFTRLLKHHISLSSLITIACTEVADCSCYGEVIIGPSNKIRTFQEKSAHVKKGTINAGIYLMNRNIINFMPQQDVYSLEKDLFPYLVENDMHAHIERAKFIDIGTPASYYLAQEYLKGT